MPVYMYVMDVEKYNELADKPGFAPDSVEAMSLITYDSAPDMAVNNPNWYRLRCVDDGPRSTDVTTIARLAGFKKQEQARVPITIADLADVAEGLA